MKTITFSGKNIPALLTIAIEMAGYPCYTPKGVWGNAHAHAFKLASLLLFLLGFNSAKCQHAITEAQYPDNIVTTIIKEYRYPATISYVETNEHHYFAYADATMNIINCEIEPYIFVRDFAILDKTVYFCGVDKSTGSNGIWGWFYIPDLMAGNLAYETYSYFVCGNHFVDSLHSIVAYNENNGLHVVTVGTAIDGTLKPSGCAIDITPSTVLPGSWDYTIGIPHIFQRKINRLCLTDNYLITVGTTDDDFEVYRRHIKSNLFAIGGIQDTFWLFPCSNFDYHYRNLNQYYITHTTGDNVASAFQTHQTYPTNNFGVLVFVHNMATLTVGAISTLFTFKQNTFGYKLPVNGLKYDKTYNNLVLLLNGPSPLGNGSYIYEFPVIFSSYPNFSLHFIDNIKLTSLDLYNNNMSLVCQGLNIPDNRLSNCYTQPLNTAAICASDYFAQESSAVFITKNAVDPFSTCTNKIICVEHIQVDSFIIPNGFKCFSRTTTR